MNILVSSPHAMCLPGKKRMCDIAASAAARAFFNAVEAAGMKCTYIEGNELRHNHDLNRKPSRSTLFRKALTSMMKEAKDRVPCVQCPAGLILVDVHSFPNYWMEEAGDINFFKPGEVPPEIVILQGPMDGFGGLSLTSTLYDSLREHSVRVKVVRGITVNDIMNEASDSMISAVLLEFNEGLLEEPRRLAFICSIVSLSLLRASRVARTY